MHLIAIAEWLPFWPEVAYSSYLSVATVALGLLLSPELRWRRVGLALEAARLLLSAGVALSGQWFGQLTLPSWVTWVIVAVAMASLVGLLAATVRNGASDMVAAPP